MARQIAELLAKNPAYRPATGKPRSLRGFFNAETCPVHPRCMNKRFTRRLRATPSLGRCLGATHVRPRPRPRDPSAGRGRPTPGRRCDVRQQAESRIGLVRPARPASGPARGRARGADSMTERPWLGAAAAAERRDTAPQRRRWSQRYGRRRGHPTSVRPRSAANRAARPLSAARPLQSRRHRAGAQGAGERRPATR